MTSHIIYNSSFYLLHYKYVSLEGCLFQFYAKTTVYDLDLYSNIAYTELYTGYNLIKYFTFIGYYMNIANKYKTFIIAAYSMLQVVGSMRTQ